MRAVFDTSVVMAILNQEPGAAIGKRCIRHALLSVVDFAEAVSILVRHCSQATIQRSLHPFRTKIMSYDAAAALQTEFLIFRAKEYRLSLGDRACLALAMAEKLPVLTADKIWKRLEKPLVLEIQLIR